MKPHVFDLLDVDGVRGKVAAASITDNIYQTLGAIETSPQVVAFSQQPAQGPRKMS